MTYIDTKHVAAAIRRRLAAEFPGAKFSVRTGRGTGSAGISVSYTDGPDSDDVTAVACTFEGSRYDGYDERYESTGNTLTVVIDGQEVTGEPLCNGVSVHQEISDEAKEEAGRRWSEWFDGADWRTAGLQDDGLVVDGEWIAPGWPVHQVGVIARKVILPARWKALQAERAEAATAAEQAPAPAPQAPAQGDPDKAVTLAHTYSDGTTVAGTRRRDGAAPILRRHGFDWNRPRKVWALSGSAGSAPDRARIDAAAADLRTAGFIVTTTLPDPAPAEAAPESYRGVPIPPVFTAEWDSLSAAAWREGVDAALTYSALRKSCDCGGCADCMTG